MSDTIRRNEHTLFLPRIKFLETDKGGLAFSLVDIIDAEQRSRKGGGFAKGYQEGFVDLSLRGYKHPAEQEYQSPDGKHKGCYEL